MELFEWLLRGGNIGALAAAAVVLWKVNTRLTREEDLRSEFPPHRHINGKVLYPRDYQPTAIERLHGGD